MKCSQKSAGVILRRGNKILLLDRAFFPFGWACPAGHLKKGEKAEAGMLRELKEETGLRAASPKMVIFRKHVKNKCVKGSEYHDWHIFEGRARGRMKRSKKETKGIGWFTPAEIKKMNLEPVWRVWFKNLKII